MGTNAAGLLRSFGFQAFLWTQFLGALNDNLFKILISMVAVNSAASSGGGGRLLSMVGAVFILPFLLFSGYAGNLADAFNKRSVLIVSKSAEIAAMGLAPFVLMSGRLEWMLGVLFFLALHSTFFSPAKYGILPEMLPDRDLSRANGLLEMTTFMAIILGTSIGGFLFAAFKGHPEQMGFILLFIALLGTSISFGIAKVPSPASRKKIQAFPWSEILDGLGQLLKDRMLLLTVLGISYFWFLGALFQMDLLLFAKEVMNLSDSRTGLLLASLAVGIGAGSLLAGRLSGDKVELGLVPPGSLGIGLFSIWLSVSGGAFSQVVAMLLLLGMSGGFFIVPLNALLQQRSGERERGRLIATNNFVNMAGILFASGILWLFRDILHITSDRIILIFGILTLAGTVFILSILPDFLIRFSLWILTHTFYRIRIAGQENIPTRGPALLVCNHLSHVDALLVGASMQRFIRFLVYRPYYEMKGLHWLLKLMNAIPVAGGNRENVAESLERARQELQNRHVVCIFAEGAISRTGNLLPFKKGFERIIQGMDIPVIPVHLDRLWGSVFSFRDGKFFWKWPGRFPYPVTVSYGKPMPATVKAQEVRHAIQELGSDAIRLRMSSFDLIHLRFLAVAKKSPFSFCMADSSGREMSYGALLAAAIGLSRWMRKHLPEEKMIGVCLPASVGNALLNLSLYFAGKVPVNLNFTAGSDALAQAMKLCGIKHLVASRSFLAKVNLGEVDGMIYLEDIQSEISGLQRISAMLTAAATPLFLLKRLYRQKDQTPDSPATVVFSSGSTGLPKGVVLSHYNIISNIEALDQVFWVTSKDRIMGVLPFFHSFGLTGTLWFPLLSGFSVVYHPNPSDARKIGEMSMKYRVTILISTPTFCSTYIRKCAPEEFSSLRFAFVGAERLREPIARAFKEKFGMELLEGYGCSEMAPVVSANAPDVHDGSEHQVGCKPGSVGHPLPGVSVKVVDPDSGRPLPAETEGLILLKGPNQMTGYLNQPELTREAMKDGWYVTGDIGFLDNDGFIHITDRLARFSKIGGEMVSHSKIEETLQPLTGDAPSVVVALPDEQKGERLILFYTNHDLNPHQVWEYLCETSLPKLWIPKKENIYRIDAIPTLGSGKTDFKRLLLAATELNAGSGAP